MKTITNLAALSLLATTLTLASGGLSTAHAGDDPDGALVGGSGINLSLDAGRHSGDAVLVAGGARKSVSGYFGMLRMNLGLLLRATRFGAEAGIEGSLGLGLITAKAYGDSKDSHISADISLGVVTVPLRLKALGGFAWKISGGLGSDHDCDYLYAGTRLGFGEDPGGLGFELAYNYRVGDTPVGAPLHEHRIGASFLFDEANIQVGLAFDFGQAYRYTNSSTARTEKHDPDTMRKGKYSDLIFTIGYVFDI